MSKEHKEKKDKEHKDKDKDKEHKEDKHKDEKKEHKDEKKDGKPKDKAAKEAERKASKAAKLERRKQGRRGAVTNLHSTLQQLLSKPESALLDIEVFPKTGRDAWDRLKVGNQRFAKGDLLGFLANMAEEISPSARANLSKTQTPYATILTCSDSRVAPELVFDEGLGELFIIRIAGNVVSGHALGSIEYGAEHLHTPLLVIMGHQSCGAVFATLSAAIEAKHATHEAHPAEQHALPKNVVDLLKPIERAATSTLASGIQDETEQMKHAVQTNVLNTKADILAMSPCVKGMVDSGKLLIVCCVYFLDTGVVQEVTGS